MPGVPRATYQNFPFQIFQGDGDLLMVYPFAATNRIVYMKDHSDLPVDSWMGKSNGAWEGDVLVITTTSQNGQSWLDRAGNFATNQLKVTERFKLLDVNHIWYEATLEDPQTFSKAGPSRCLLSSDRQPRAAAGAQVRSVRRHAALSRPAAAETVIAPKGAEESMMIDEGKESGQCTADC